MEKENRGGVLNIYNNFLYCLLELIPLASTSHNNNERKRLNIFRLKTKKKKLVHSTRCNKASLNFLSFLKMLKQEREAKNHLCVCVLLEVSLIN